jgi:hypothetical protein
MQSRCFSKRLDWQQHAAALATESAVFFCCWLLLFVFVADGDEGGRHQLVGATVSGGKLWMVKVQIGDKRWFKGAKKEALGAFNSFTVA